MIRLGQSLALRSADSPLWYARAGWRSVGQVQWAAEALRARIGARRVALALAGDESLALGLLAVEGRCEAVLLVPSAWDQAQLDRYWTRSGVELLVTDRADLVAPAVLRLTDETVSSADRTDAECETAWIVPTSGTTGEPKLVEHRLASLARTIKTDKAKGADLTWGLVYELARFAGLQVFLQAVLGGSRLVFARRAAGTDALVDDLLAGGCNAVSATPTLWRRLMMAATADRLALRCVTLGGEIADQAILSLLAARFPAAKVIHIYASTEAGVGFSVTDGRAGFPVSFLRQPPRGVELKVEADGLLWLRPETRTQRFVGAERALVGEDGWINSGDQVHVESDRGYFLGRANGAINVGGNKVFPEEIETCIRSVAGVLQAGVRARPSPIVGSLVEAFVQPTCSADRVVLKKAILGACRVSLAPYKVPALVTWVDDLVVNSAGKLSRS